MNTVVRRRPGGRTARVGRAVAEATLALIREGHLDFSMVDVAEAAGVHRSTVYRRWPTRAALIDEALTLHHAHLPIPDTDDFDADLVTLVHRLADHFANPVERALNIASAGNRNPELGEALRRHWRPIGEQLNDRLRRAIADDQLAADTDLRTFSLMLFGSLLAATLFDPRPFTENRRAGLVRALRSAFPR